MLRFRDLAIIFTVTIVAALFLKMFVLEAVFIPSASMEETLLPGDFVLVNKLSLSSASSSSSSLNATIPFLSFSKQVDVERGDVVVFRFPGTAEKSVLAKDDLLVKRCVAKGGDLLEISKGSIWVNGERKAFIEGNPSLRSETKLFPPNENFTFNNYGPIRIPKQGDIILLTKETYQQWENLIRSEGHSVSWSDVRGCLLDGQPVETYVIKENYLFMLGDNFFHSYDSRFWGFLPEKNVIGDAAIVYWSLEENHRSKSVSDFLGSIRWGRIGMFIN
ncbi:MAG: signal peptidase I [Ignavibacteriae bacterium]|nr:signal peptidase I [Ignavibacteriota bacterium]